MKRILAAVVVSIFALGSTAGFAADAAKSEELTKEQRADMRNRADKLTAERAAGASHVKAEAKHASTAQKHHAKKVKKASKHHATKTQPKS